MRRNLLIVLIVLLGVLILIQLGGCGRFKGFISLYDPPRQGKVVDADTGEPIENVVVMGYWDIFYLHHLPLALLNPGGQSSTYYDARETETDENGHYTLPGLGLWVYPGRLEGPYLKAYKNGYDILALRSVKEDNLRIVTLRKLDEEESIGRISLPHRQMLSDKNKIKRFLQEIDY